MSQPVGLLAVSKRIDGISLAHRVHADIFGDMRTVPVIVGPSVAHVMTIPTLPALVPPVPTPLCASGTVDGGALHRIADHLHSAGVRAGFVLGSTGELPSLSDRQRREVLRLAAEAFDGRLLLLAGIGDPCLEETLSLAETAAREGAAAVVLNAPSYYEISGHDMRAWLDDIVPRLPLPFVLYNMPWLTGHAFDDDTIRHALDFPTLAGFKDSSGDLGYFANLVRLARARAGLPVFMGNDFLVLDSLERGGHGAVAGGTNLYPSLFAELIEAFAAGDRGRAVAAQETISRLGRSIFPVTGQPASVFSAVKGGLAALGLCEPTMLPPLTTCGPAEIAALRHALDEATLATAATA